MAVTPVAEEKLVIGSGNVYIVEFTGTMPADATIETEDNRLGKISGGAQLEYKASYYTAEDDLGTVSKTRLTKEDVTLKTGLITWCGKTLQKIVSTARVTEAAGKRTVKIGGIANDDGKKYALRFVHDDVVEGKTRITIVGNNQAGFSLAYLKDKETSVDAVFTAHPMDSEGTKVIYEEQIPTV